MACGHHGDPVTSTPVLLAGATERYRSGDAQVHVLVDFGFALRAGEFVVVNGNIRVDESSLLHIAGGLDAPGSGTVLVAGQDSWTMRAGARAASRRRNLGFVFQFFNLGSMLIAVENVSLPMLLERIGLGDRARHRPPELSGGQMQRVAMTRALVAGPPIEGP